MEIKNSTISKYSNKIQYTLYKIIKIKTIKSKKKKKSLEDSTVRVINVEYKVSSFEVHRLTLIYNVPYKCVNIVTFGRYSRLVCFATSMSYTNIKVGLTEKGMYNLILL